MIEVEWCEATDGQRLTAVYRTQLDLKELVMALQDQIATLTTEVATLTGKVATLQTTIDAEQVQIAAALGLLTQDNPDVAAAIVALQAASAGVTAATDDVASTIPDAP